MDEEHEQILMLKKFPMLIPINNNFTLYKGYFRAGEQDWQLSIDAPRYPLLTDMKLQYCWKLGQILEKCQPEIDDCRNKCSTLYEYLCAFQHLVEMQLRLPDIAACFPLDRRPTVKAYENVCAELERVGGANVVSLTGDLKQLQLSCVDYTGRKHLLHMELKAHSEDYALRAEVPPKVMLQEVPGRSISQYYSAFVQLVASLEDFLDDMEELDEHCWVVDPEKPDRTHTHRRINIADAVSVLVTVDPLRVRARPDLKVLGSVSGAAPFLAALNRSVVAESWSTEVNIASNLLNELELPCFPSQPAAPADAHLQLVQAGECHVCYETRGEGDQLADVACEGEKCGRVYHKACLYKWLTMGGQGKTMYNRVHGPCPNCNKTISCPVPQP